MSLSVFVVGVLSQVSVDGGAIVSAADAGVPETVTFDQVMTPWGPGRRSSGERFRSMAAPLSPGPLRLSGTGWSLGAGVQYLARFEGRDNVDLRSEVVDPSAFVEHRARLSVRGSAVERVGILVELQDVRGWGTERSTTFNEPLAGLHQGFVDLRVVPGVVDVRVGRQELGYGEDRLIGTLDWAMAARSFDGLFTRVAPAPWLTVDGFGFLLRPPAVGDGPGGERVWFAGQVFSGVYARARPGGALPGVDVYGLFLHDSGPASEGMAGRGLNLATVGARVSVAFPAVAVIAEGAFQTGQQLGATVVAGAYAVRATVPLPAGLYVGAEVLGASGDGDAQDGVERGFNQLFPTAHLHLGFMDYFAWSNVHGFKGTVGWRPGPVHLWVDVHHFRAWDARGAWTAAGGARLLVADPTRTESDRGVEVDLSATVPLWPQVALAGALSVYLPGAGTRGRGSAPSTWGFVSIRAQL